MAIADITLAAFTLCNSLRVVAYVPQIAKAATDRSGAAAISFGTWGLFLVSHMSAMAYAVVNCNDWTMAAIFLANAIGCGAILLIAAWKRFQYRRKRVDEVLAQTRSRVAIQMRSLRASQSISSRSTAPLSPLRE
jgi:hypothetical protein